MIVLYSKEKEITILNNVSPRDIYSISYFAQELGSIVNIVKDRCANAKSILGLMSLCLAKDDIIIISTKNENQEVAENDLDKMVKYMRTVGEENEY